MPKVNYVPKPYSENKPHIFVSYSHKDTDEVFPLIGQLTVDGYRVWYDGGIEPATDWLEYITNQVISCEYMLCMISDKYADSHYCVQEMDIALHHGKKIVPVYLDEKRMESHRQSQLDRFQGLIMSELGSTKRFFERLYSTGGLAVCRDPELISGPIHEENKRQLEELMASPDYRLRELLKSIKDGKTPYESIKESLDSILYDVREKADLIASFWKEVKEDIRIIEEEEKRLKARREAKKSTCECLETYISDMLQAATVEKVELSNRITFRKSEETSIPNPEAFVIWAEQNEYRDLLKYSPPKPDTTAIKRAIKNGAVLEGAEIITKQNIQIK